MNYSLALFILRLFAFIFLFSRFYFYCCCCCCCCSARCMSMIRLLQTIKSQVDPFWTKDVFHEWEEPLIESPLPLSVPRLTSILALFILIVGEEVLADTRRSIAKFFIKYGDPHSPVSAIQTLQTPFARPVTPTINWYSWPFICNISSATHIIFAQANIPFHSSPQCKRNRRVFSPRTQSQQ